MLRVYWCAVAAAAFAVEAMAQQAAVDFRRDIEPVLKASCFACHAGKQAGGQLRLDAKKLAMKGGVSGAVLVPGNSKDSLMVSRLLGHGGQPRMPMGGKPLPEAQVALIRRWIDAGAEWPGDGDEVHAEVKKHWAYVKPVRPAAPTVQDSAWVRNPIDAFVLARLEKEGLKPSPEASSPTLIRRVTLDLTGLPPTVREVDEFLADRRPDAYEKLVDRLLASPHYGERWARPWLDLARYADTNGFEKDNRRTIWKYRDWVIAALNGDMPYDRFTIEQLAGDMLPKPTPDQLIATGFHRNTMFNEEGGVDADEAHWENLVDRVNTTATVWMGSTVGCAQCHNHKFDPFTQKEYYQLMAFFSNSEKTAVPWGTGEKYLERELDLPTEAQAARRKELQAEIAGLEKVVKTQTPELAAAQARWERITRAAPSEWTVLEPAAVTSTGGTTLTRQTAGAILASGANPASDTYVIDAPLPAGGITGLRIEALPHESLPRGGPGRDSYGNFFIAEVSAEIVKAGHSESLCLENPVADDGRLSDRRIKQVWAVDASREDKRLPRQVVFVTASPSGARGDLLRLHIRHHSDFGGQGIGHFRLSVTAGRDPVRVTGISAKLRPLLDIPEASRTEEQRRSVTDYYLGVAPALAIARERLSALRTELDDLGIVTTQVMGEAPGYERPSALMRVRGTFTNPGERVYAGVPAVLPPLSPSDMPNRLGLARWLVSEENPLTARVAVNRFWEQYFGRGIVETPEDFGTQSPRPTHPELLDWLATEFMRVKWSMKQMHRTIVTSATYRQSSAISPALLDRDPYNKLLARGPRFRMEAEMIRDTALAAAGRLSAKIGGPSVFPYQPEGIWDIPYSDDKWTESEGEDRYRRGLYTFVRRTSPYPSLLTFDAPAREVCTVRRIRTNTPLQALTALNDPAFFEAARGLAHRILAEGGPDTPSRAAFGFRLCLARKPKPEELDRVITAIEKERTWFAGHSADAAKLGGADTAAWTMLANVLLNLDETLTKE